MQLGAVVDFALVIPAPDQGHVPMDDPVVGDDRDLPGGPGRERTQRLEEARPVEDGTVFVDVNGVGRQGPVPQAPVARRYGVEQSLISGPEGRQFARWFPNGGGQDCGGEENIEHHTA